jgi:cardiolipin synthase A/B
MNSSRERAAEVAASLAERLPVGDLSLLTSRLTQGAQAVEDLHSTTGSSDMREACRQLLECLETASAEYVTGCLGGACRAVENLRHQSRVDVVWTGPASFVDTGRLTSAVVIQLFNSAQHELLLASFATFPDRDIHDALQDACNRGVDVTLLLERSLDNRAYQGGDDVFGELPLRRVVWPPAKRPPGAALHTKFIIVDKESALVGSANLTGRAMDDNIECGLLIRGGRVPRGISEHIWGLVHAGVLTVIAN